MERILLIVGLAVTVVGAIVAAWNVIISQETAATLSSTMWDENKAFRDALVAQSHGAAWGLVIVVVGTVIQIAGVPWPILVARR